MKRRPIVDTSFISSPRQTFAARQRGTRKAAKSLSKNSEGCCFRAKSWMARRDEGEYPSWVFDRGATKPAGCLLENPPGGRSFGCGPRWLGRYSPLWGCPSLAALPTSKIPRRSAPLNFQKGYKISGLREATQRNPCRPGRRRHRIRHWWRRHGWIG